MVVKPILDVVEWLCPVCSVRGLNLKDERCYNCNFHLDWSDFVESNDSKTRRYCLSK